jgi:hypothetical protein
MRVEYPEVIAARRDGENSRMPVARAAAKANIWAAWTKASNCVPAGLSVRRGTGDLIPRTGVIGVATLI